MLSELTTADIIGIIGIAATVGVGITIFWMQRKADDRSNKFVIEQYRLIHRDDEPKESDKEVLYPSYKGRF